MSDVRYWLGFNLVSGIGPVGVLRLLRHFGDLEPAWKANAATLRAVGLRQDGIEQLITRRSHMDLDAELDKVKAAGVHIVTWDDEGYPSLLKNIDQPPPLLYVRGSILPDDDFALAIVGTRKCKDYGMEVTRRLASELAENGITVVSGMALGIDGVAHRAALDAGGRTLAVFGCGLDIVYPARHRDLAQRIAQSGALISDYPLGAAPDASNFPPRNRIISGLSLGTLVTEAGIKSGALITARFALDQGRETFAVPGSVFSRTSAGTNALIQRGEAKLVTCVVDILEELNLTMVSQQKEVRTIVPDTPMEETLLGYLGAEPVHLDEIVRGSGLSTATVSSTLSMMELKGMVRRVDSMSYVLAH